MDGYVDHEKIKQLVNYENSINDYIKDNSSSIVKNIRELDDVCSGKTIDSLISSITEQASRFQHLDKVYQSYVDVLMAIDKAYALQSATIGQQLNQMAQKNVRE